MHEKKNIFRKRLAAWPIFGFSVAIVVTSTTLSAVKKVIEEAIYCMQMVNAHNDLDASQIVDGTQICTKAAHWMLFVLV